MGHKSDADIADDFHGFRRCVPEMGDNSQDSVEDVLVDFDGDEHVTAFLALAAMLAVVEVAVDNPHERINDTTWFDGAALAAPGSGSDDHSCF
jgi:hypothetical protein